VSLKQTVKPYVPNMHFNSGAGCRWLNFRGRLVGTSRDQTIPRWKETKPGKKSP
jgi:hypothetical protein